MISRITAERPGTPCPWPRVPERSITRSVDNADEACQRISDWLHKCTTSHTCESGQVLAFLPKRVVEIRAPERVRLYCSEKNQEGIYLCLSHCWGGKVPLQLTKATFQIFQQDIPWKKLPLTFQQAISLTRKLGFRYLWIDSLCILQDDLDDWREEGSNMASIYSGARLTLAATGSPDSNGGLHRSQTAESNSMDGKALTLHHFVDKEGSAYSICVRSITDARRFVYRDLPLQKRAWFFQEWLLSPRIVHFTESMLFWECLAVEQGEDGTRLARSEYSGAGKRSTLVSFDQTPRDSLSTLSQSSFQRFVWHELVHSYSTLQLSYSTDVFPSLQGVTTRVAAKRQSRYYAGLWEDSIVVDLLWLSYGGLSNVSHHKDEYLAPSWSWASATRKSLAHGVMWQDWYWTLGPDYQSEFIPEVSVVSIMTKTVDDNPFGQVLSGELVLKGVCLPAWQMEGHLIPRTNRLEEYDYLCSFGLYSEGDFERLYEWHPDNESILSRSSDIQLMLIGSWPRIKSPWATKNYAYESWFLAFECIDPVGDIYRRLGVFYTMRLAFRARFLREATEQELTII